MRQSFERVAAIFAAALVGIAGPAAAQSERCANPMATCAGPLSQDCLQRLGAGVISAEAAGCAEQLASYRSCLSDIVETCGGGATAGASACDSETASILWDDVKQADDCLGYQGYRDACPDTPQARIAATRLTRLGCAAPATTADGRGQQGETDARDLRVLSGHERAVSAIRYLDANRALSASKDGTLKLWDLGAGRVIRTLLGHDETVSDVAISPDGASAVSAGTDGAVLLWSLESGQPSILGRHTDAVRSVVVTPDGERAVTTSWGEGEGLKIWDLNQRREVLILDKVFAMSSAIAISPDGSLVVGASYDDPTALRVFSLNRRSVLRTAEPGDKDIGALAFSPDGQKVMIGRLNGEVTLQDMRGDRPLITLAPEGGARVSSVAFGALGNLAISATEGGRATVWNLRDNRASQTLDTDDVEIRSAAISPDRKSVLVGLRNGDLKLWPIGAN